MLDDVVREEHTNFKSFDLARLSLLERQVSDLKRGLKALTEDVSEILGKPLLHTLKSTQDTVVMGYANMLKRWTRKLTASVVYDSSVCPFTDECLFQMVKDKPNVALVASTTEGDVFGGFYSVAVTEQDETFKDPDMFLFSFESHGRCKLPKKFAVKEGEREYAYVNFYKDDSCLQFVKFHGYQCNFYLGNDRSKTYCDNLSCGFEGVEDTTLTGKNRENFTCCRLVAIHLT